MSEYPGETEAQRQELQERFPRYLVSCVTHTGRPLWLAQPPPLTAGTAAELAAVIAEDDAGRGA